MASAGLSGVLPYLRTKNLQKIDKYNLYKRNVYKREQEQYNAFCTPEYAKCFLLPFQIVYYSTITMHQLNLGGSFLQPDQTGQ